MIVTALVLGPIAVGFLLYLIPRTAGTARSPLCALARPLVGGFS